MGVLVRRLITRPTTPSSWNSTNSTAVSAKFGSRRLRLATRNLPAARSLPRVDCAASEGAHASAARTHRNQSRSAMKPIVLLFGASRLLKLGEVGWAHVDRFRLLHDRPGGFGFLLHLLPFGIGAKLGPVLGGGFAAGMGHELDHGVLGSLRVLRDPIADALHVVALEDGDGVIAEASLESLQFAIVAGVRSEERSVG